MSLRLIYASYAKGHERSPLGVTQNILVTADQGMVSTNIVSRT